MIEPGQIVSGSLFNEPMRVETIRPGGNDTWVLGLVVEKRLLDAMLLAVPR